MGREGESYRQILRSSSIIGGASVINIAVGLLRTKVAAVVLGPPGIGLIGIYSSVLGTAAAVGGLGLGNAGTRQIAEAVATEDATALFAARRALFSATLVVAPIASALFWLFRGVIAREVVGDVSHASDVGWLGLAVALTIAASSQSAVLSGLRRLGDLARVSVIAGAVSTIIGAAFLLFLGARGLVGFVLAAPAATCAVGALFLARPRRGNAGGPSLGTLQRQWRALLALGFAYMLASLAGLGALLLTRAVVEQQLGLDALGYFQAAWTISMTYVGIVLGAMAADFYPRLTGMIADKERANRLVNQQTEVAILVSAPIFLAVLAFAPWLIRVLYTSSFLPTAAILRWQVLGDILKVASWPLGFVVLASGDARTFLLAEAVTMAIFATGSILLLPGLGVEATGVAFLAMYLFYLPLLYWLVRRKTGFGWARSVKHEFTVLLALATATSVVGLWTQIGAAVLGGSAAVVFGAYALLRLSQLTTTSEPVLRLERLLREFLRRLGVHSG